VRPCARAPVLRQVRNAQLCIFTIPIAFAGTFMVDDPYLREDGSFLHGFNFVVWAAIFTNAAGGMIVAVVMKFAGNILRNFAQARLACRASHPALLTKSCRRALPAIP
jgi:UDP-sugar transporter A1/2/3